jgi:hypothetical protein
MEKGEHKGHAFKHKSEEGGSEQGGANSKGLDKARR